MARHGVIESALIKNCTFDPPLSGGSGAVSSFNGRTGAIVPVVGDYSSFYATTAQGAKADTAIQSIPWASPGAIGSTTANTGTFTNLSSQDYKLGYDLKIVPVGGGQSAIISWWALQLGGLRADILDGYGSPANIGGGGSYCVVVTPSSTKTWGGYSDAFTTLGVVQQPWQTGGFFQQWLKADGTVLASLDLSGSLAVKSLVVGSTPAQFDQQTPPTSPAVGARWRERDANNRTIGNWEWNGTYWVTDYVFLAAPAGYITGASSRGIAVPPFPNCSGLLIESYKVVGRVATAHNATNKLTFQLQSFNLANTVVNIGTAIDTTTVSTSSDTTITPVSTAIAVPFTNFQSLVVTITSTGTPSALGYNSVLTARYYR